MERRKMRLRQEWHMRWPHSSLADFEAGMSSDKQIVHVTTRGGSLFEAGDEAPRNVDNTPPLFFLLCKEGLWFLADDDDMVDSATKETLDVGIVVWRLCTVAGLTTAARCGEVDPNIASKPNCLCRFLCLVDLVLGVTDMISASISVLGELNCSSAQYCGTGAGGQRSSGHSSTSSKD